MKIIFAQGNPEPDYTSTRHNVGFEVLNSFATKNNLKWSEKSKFHAFIAEFSLGGEKIILVKPTTFYNESGKAARAIIDFYKIETEKDLLVIHDDLALPFGTIRTREQGSDAGNNGIKSINSHLSPNYHRIRIGISSEMREKMGDADFVLARFSTDESDKLIKNIIPKTIEFIENFYSNKLNITSHTFDK